MGVLGAVRIGLHAFLFVAGLQCVLGAIAIYGRHGLAYPVLVFSFVAFIARSVHPSRLVLVMVRLWSSSVGTA